MVLEFKVILCVIIADVFNHPVQSFLVVREQALLDIIAKQVAKQTAEILMAGIREERAAVCQHTDKAAQQA